MKTSKSIDCAAAQVEAQVSAPRILFVITSFDRGRRLRTMKDVDKLDYVLMIMDEIREACEVGGVSGEVWVTGLQGTGCVRASHATFRFSFASLASCVRVDV